MKKGIIGHIIGPPPPQKRENLEAAREHVTLRAGDNDRNRYE